MCLKGQNCEIALNHLESCVPGYCQSNSECRLTTPVALTAPSTSHNDVENEHTSIECLGCRWRAEDSDERCRLLSVSFNGDSLLFYPRSPSRLDWMISFKFATISPKGSFFQNIKNRSEILA